MKRLMIYFFYDNDGIVDDYVPYFLEKFKPYCEEICTVINGTVTEESKEKLKKYSSLVFERENISFDSGAYKYAIEHYGYEKLREYDELILANFTMFGPIFSPQELFNTMEKRDCDFWGITKHPSYEHYFAGVKIDEHVQSYFIVYKKNILCSKDFEEYWNTLQTATTYEEAIAFHELRTTKFFEERGYKSDTYINLEKYLSEIKNKPYYYSILQQVKEDRMPFIKRKIFLVENNNYFNDIKGGITPLLEYLEKNSDYNLNMIYENIRRSNFVNLDISSIKKQYNRCKILQYVLFHKWKHYHEKVEIYKNRLRLINFLEERKIEL